jgi:hypothetical protein
MSCKELHHEFLFYFIFFLAASLVTRTAHIRMVHWVKATGADTVSKTISPENSPGSSDPGLAREHS